MASYKPRLTKPEKGNPYYNTKANGGYSNAIKGSPVDPDCDVLSNCVGYAYGRFNEIGGWGSCKYLVPTNAEKFIQYKGSLEVGQTPKLGACMVWQKGATLSGNDGAGHVAIVEQIISETEVVTSDSGYGGAAFWTSNRKKGNGDWGAGAGYTFLGFIYNPAECCKDVPTVVKPTQEPIVAPTTKIGKGDVVKIATGATYYNSTKVVPGWVLKKQWIVKENPVGSRVVIDKSTDGKNSINSAIDAKYLTVVSAAKKEPEIVKPADHVKPVEPVKPWEPAEGDIVQFNGGTQYSNSNATTGKQAAAGQAKITRFVSGKKHPYHLVRTGKTGPYGWVDRNTFEKA